jgi:hypothetical protein
MPAIAPLETLEALVVGTGVAVAKQAEDEPGFMVTGGLVDADVPGGTCAKRISTHHWQMTSGNLPVESLTEK